MYIETVFISLNFNRVSAMHRPRIIGLILIIISSALLAFSFLQIFGTEMLPLPVSLAGLSAGTYYSLAIPLGLIWIGIMGTGFWIGWTILTLKVETPMPEINNQKDTSKIKAAFLCVVTLALAGMFVWGIVIQSYWALAIPAAAVTLTVLGAIFWVGWAVLSARNTLNQ